jgi:hypothetical protein
MKHFIIIITVIFLLGTSGLGLESPAYAYGDNYVKVWDSGNILPNPVYTAAVNDLDRDYKTEIIVSDNSKTYGAKIFIFENSGDNSYQLVWDSGGVIAGNDCYISIAVGDLDKDGKREIITIDHQPLARNMKVYVLENVGDNNYQLAWDSGDTLFGEDGASVLTGDADSDGRSEIIVGTGWGHADKGKIYVFENTGDNTYEEVWNSEGILVDSVLPGAVGDSDKDGKKEIIVGSGDIDPQIHIFENTGDNSYALVWDSGSFFSRQMRVTIGDADNDGNEEIIAGSVDRLVCVFENAGDNSYQLAWTSPVMPHYMHFVSIGDQDNDGKKEIIAPCQDNVVYLFENTGDDTYEMVWNSGNLLGGIACQTVPGDTDGDGKGEIIVPCYDKKVYVFEHWMNQPPVVDAGLDQIMEQQTYEGTEVTQIGHVSDVDGDALTYQWKEGDTVLASGTIPASNTPPTDADVTLTHIFTPGKHIVTLNVSDGEISSSDDVVIIVQDTTPPEISVSVSPNVLWPPNHKMVNVQAMVTIHDVGDPNPTWALVSITSNEAEEGPGKKHSPDIMGHEPGTPDLEFQLRAERLGQGDGRVYTITYQAIDSSGNSFSAEAIVFVPHDMGKGI